MVCKISLEISFVSTYLLFKIFSKEVPPKRTQGEGKKDEFVVDKIEKKAKGGRIGFKGGKLVGTKVGATSEKDMLEFIQPHI